MTDFDQRWQKLARQADGLLDEALPELPFGYATRILARSRDTSPETWEDIVSALGLRAIFATAALCAVTAALAYMECFPARIETPVFEQASTSDLSLLLP